MDKKMKAWVIRKERYGVPEDAMRMEEVRLRELHDDEILVRNIAAGVNHNGIWASAGYPKDVVEVQKQYGNDVDFMIAGSESAGIVEKVGKNVTDFKAGDEVICYSAQYNADEEADDPRTGRSFRVWGYENNWGAFAEYSIVQQTQCFPKPEYLSWEEAGCTVAAGSTVYSMLTHWSENRIKEGDTVLIWGGTGAVGISAIILVRLLGGIPVAVVSDEEKMKLCMELGAAGCINRKNYPDIAPVSPEMLRSSEYDKWLYNAMKMRRDIWKVSGKRQDPAIVIEHPGESTMALSLFLCAKKGMVVTCGATTGYAGTFDLRHLWMHLKRIQGSHVCCGYEVQEYLKIMEKNNKKMPIERVYAFEETAKAHMDLMNGKSASGRLVVRISDNQS